MPQLGIDKTFALFRLEAHPWSTVMHKRRPKKYGQTRHRNYDDKGSGLSENGPSGVVDGDEFTGVSI
jgi:hypothetical protein